MHYPECDLCVRWKAAMQCLAGQTKKRIGNLFTGGGEGSNGEIVLHLRSPGVFPGQWSGCCKCPHFASSSSLSYYTVTNGQFGHLFEGRNDHHQAETVEARGWRSASGLMEEDQDGPTVSLTGAETCGNGSTLYDINGNASTVLF